MSATAWLSLTDARWPLDFSCTRHGALAESYFRFYGIDSARVAPAARHCFGWFPAAGERLAAHGYLPERPTGSCLVLHGYYDHVGLFRHPMRWALRRSLSVFAYDLPGHGLSTGPRADIADFSTYQETLSAACALLDEQPDRFPRPWHVVAQSTGAAITMDYLLNGGSAFSGVLLLAPLYRPAHWRSAWLAHTLRRRCQADVPRSFRVNSGDPAFCRFVAERDPLQHRRLPLRWVSALRSWNQRMASAPPREDIAPLALQGDCDGTVDWRGNLALLAQKFPRLRCRMVDGAEHHLANESRHLRERMADMMDGYLNRCGWRV